MKKIFILLIPFLAVTFSCEKKTEKSINMGYNYFPIQLGNYHIYNVDSTVYDDFNNTTIKYHYQVKMQMVEKFTDNENRIAYRWKKYTKTDTTNWCFSKNYSFVITDLHLEINIENTPYIKLIFPVQAGKQWNSNALNTNDKTEAIYSDVDYQKTINSISYDSCALVIFEEEVNLIQEFVHKEIYAKNVGMIYRKHIHKQKQITGMQGYEIVYQLIKYGNE